MHYNLMHYDASCIVPNAIAIHNQIYIPLFVLCAQHQVCRVTQLFVKQLSVQLHYTLCERTRLILSPTKLGIVTIKIESGLFWWHLE